jgi:hypothetical protein
MIDIIIHVFRCPVCWVTFISGLSVIGGCLKGGSLLRARKHICKEAHEEKEC